MAVTVFKPGRGEQYSDRNAPVIQNWAHDVVPNPLNLAMPRMDAGARQAPEFDTRTRNIMAILTGLGALGTVATGGRGKLGAITQGMARGGAAGQAQAYGSYQAQQTAYEKWLQDVQEYNADAAGTERKAGYEVALSDRTRSMDRQDDATKREWDREDDRQGRTWDREDDQAEYIRDRDLWSHRGGIAEASSAADHEREIAMLKREIELKASDPLEQARLQAELAQVEYRRAATEAQLALRDERAGTTPYAQARTRAQDALATQRENNPTGSTGSSGRITSLPENDKQLLDTYETWKNATDVVATAPPGGQYEDGPREKAEAKVAESAAMMQRESQRLGVPMGELVVILDGLHRGTITPAEYRTLIASYR